MFGPESSSSGTGRRGGGSAVKFVPAGEGATIPKHVQGLLAVSTILMIISLCTLIVTLYIASEVKQEYSDLDIKTTVPMIQAILTRVQDQLKDPKRADNVFSAIEQLDIALKKADAADLINTMARFMKSMTGT